MNANVAIGRNLPILIGSTRYWHACAKACKEYTTGVDHVIHLVGAQLFLLLYSISALNNGMGRSREAETSTRSTLNRGTRWPKVWHHFYPPPLFFSH